MTAAAAGWSPLSMPARPAWLGARPQRRNTRCPIVCDPPYMHVCPGRDGKVRCRAIIPRHLDYCPDHRENGDPSP